MHNRETVLKNETQKLVRDFKTQTDQLISARQPDLLKINKEERSCRIEDFSVPANHRVKLKEREKRDKYLDLAEKSPGDLRRLAVTQIPVKDHQLTPIWKTLKE